MHVDIGHSFEQILVQLRMGLFSIANGKKRDDRKSRNDVREEGRIVTAAVHAIYRGNYEDVIDGH